MRIAICDDKAEDRATLIYALEKYFKEKNTNIHITEFDAGEKMTADYMNELRYSMIFMDIYMAKLNGIDTVKEIRKLDKRVPVIFLSTSSEFGVESYAVDADGYLLKPLHENELRQALDRIMKRNEKNTRFVCRTHDGIQLLAMHEIMYLESRGHKVIIHLSGGDHVEMRDKLLKVKEQLDSIKFLQTHQSYIVNMDYISKVGRDFELYNGEIVPIRVKSKKEITEKYYHYFVKYIAGVDK